MSLSYLNAEQQHGELQKRTHLSFPLFSFPFLSRPLYLFPVSQSRRKSGRCWCVPEPASYMLVSGRWGLGLAPPLLTCARDKADLRKNIYWNGINIDSQVFSDALSTWEARINHLKHFEAKSFKAVCRRAGQGVCDLNPSASHSPGLDLNGTVHILDQRSIEHTWPVGSKVEDEEVSGLNPRRRDRPKDNN